MQLCGEIVQEAINFLSQCQVHAQSQRRLLSHFLTMQPSMEKSRSVVHQLSSPACQISSKEETPSCSRIWRPWYFKTSQRLHILCIRWSLWSLWYA
ncbi:transcription factor HES-5-like [Clarias magur]|uniref:Transcription factor HES-5-like n=1 Tax=Clarias magur TaxID=1594786 RepID=A0A8J4XFG1_CLAMG|nr:transcription factor HES-5-like [Clarias magur]